MIGTSMFENFLDGARVGSIPSQRFHQVGDIIFKNSSNCNQYPWGHLSGVRVVLYLAKSKLV